MKNTGQSKGVVRKRAGSCYITIPPAIMASCDLKAGDSVSINAERGSKFSVEKEGFSLDSIGERFKEMSEAAHDLLVQRTEAAVEVASLKLDSDVSVKVTQVKGEPKVKLIVNGKEHSVEALEADYKGVAELFGVDALPVCDFIGREGTIIRK